MGSESRMVDENDSEQRAHWLVSGKDGDVSRGCTVSTCTLKQTGDVQPRYSRVL